MCIRDSPGITQAAVSYETETADILYDSSVISLEQIQGLIDELGDVYKRQSLYHKYSKIHYRLLNACQH